MIVEAAGWVRHDWSKDERVGALVGSQLNRKL